MFAVHVFVCGSQCRQLCTCALACLWQDSVQITLSPFVSPNVNVEVSGGDGALVKKSLPSVVGVPVGKGRNVRCTHTGSVWCQCIWLYLCMRNATIAKVYGCNTHYGNLKL